MTRRKPRPLPGEPVPAAKSVALAFHAAVAVRDIGQVEKIAGGMTWEQLAALAAVLAEGIGPDATRLRAVTLASDDETDTELAA